MQTRRKNESLMCMQDPRPIVIYVCTQLQFKHIKYVQHCLKKRSRNEKIDSWNEGLEHVINYNDF